MKGTMKGAGRGRVYLVGAGPGDPGLLTLRGQHCLAQADVVVHDDLVNRRLLEHARADAEIVDVGRPHGGPGRLTQAAIADVLIARAREGRTVVRLKSGDPHESNLRTKNLRLYLRRASYDRLRASRRTRSHRRRSQDRAAQSDDACLAQQMRRARADCAFIALKFVRLRELVRTESSCVRSPRHICTPSGSRMFLRLFLPALISTIFRTWPFNKSPLCFSFIATKFPLPSPLSNDP